MRDIESIHQIDVLSGDGQRGWDGIIRWEIFKQFTKFTYALETDAEDGIGWSDERYWVNSPNWRTSWRRMKSMIRRDIWPSSRTFWRRMKRMGWDDLRRDLKPIHQIDVLSGDGCRGWNRMIRWEILSQFTTLTYQLETDEEHDQMRDLKTFGQVHVRSGDGWKWRG